MTFYLCVAATLFIATITLLPLWRNEAWLVRGLDFPRLQFSVLAAGLLLLEGFVLDLSRPSTWGLLGVVFLCLIYQAWWIVPYTRLHPVEVKSASGFDGRRTLTLMTSNVLATNRNAEGLIELVRENAPDVLVTLESDAWWQMRLEVLEEEYPHTIKCPQDNLYGMHLYSRFRLMDSKIEYLVEPDVPSIHTLIVLPGGQKVRAHFLHPVPPGPTGSEKSSERDAELLVVAQSVAETDAPVVVAGDLNDVVWSETTRLFKKISGLIDPRVGRGLYNTYHADYWFIRWPLDHLFHSGHFTLKRMRRLRRFGSDHFALLAQLVYEEDRTNKQDGLDAEAEDRAWANDKLKDKDVDKDDVPTPGGI